MKWFYIDESILSGDRRLGPFTTEEMISFRQENRIQDLTLVWHTDQDGWISWEKSSELLFSKEKQKEELLEKALGELLQNIPEQNFHYAGFFVRAFALLIDGFFLTFFSTIILFCLQIFQVIDMKSLEPLLQAYLKNPMSSELSNQILSNPGIMLFMVLSFLACTLYTLYFTIRYSATPGKMFLRLKIRNGDGSPFHWKNAVFRYFASLLTQATLIFYGFGYILAVVDPKKRTLHDFFAKTVVVHSSQPEEKVKDK